MTAIKTEIGKRDEAVDTSVGKTATLPYTNVQQALVAMRAEIDAILATLPGSSVDNTVPRFNGTAGAIEDTGLTISDTDFLGGAAGVGIGGATADTTNRLSVNTPAVLFNRETANIQVKLNKAAAGDTASFLFQTGFSSRAEIGLVGNDDFAFKVSPDGSSFTNAIVIDKDDGAVAFVGAGAFGGDVTVPDEAYNATSWNGSLEVPTKNAVRDYLELLTGTTLPAAYQPLDSDLTALAGNSTNGLWARTGAGTGAARTLTGPAAGLTVSNGDGVSGNPTLALANDLSALEGLASTGLAARTATDTWAQRTITGTGNQITVTNGDGASGNPTLSLPADVLIPTVITIPNTGLHILDTNASHDLIIAPGSNITADRTLTVTTGDADRTLTISGNSTINQDYSTTGNPQFATVELGNASDTTLSRSAAGRMAVEGVDVKLVGKETIWVPAGAMKARVSSGAGSTDYDSGTNDITIPTLAFDTTTQEYAHFHIAMPKSWNEGTVTFQAYWTNTGGSSTQTVQWALAGVAMSDDDTLNAARGTAGTVSDTWLAQNDLHISSESSAITIGGTPAENDLVVFEISRDVANDNMSGDALLIGIKLFITINAANDG